MGTSVPGDADTRSTAAAVARYSWLIILPAMVLGLAPPLVAVVLGAGLAIGYVAGGARGKVAMQEIVAYVIGGLCAGAGVVMLARLDRAGRAGLGWAGALGICVGGRAGFVWLERRFGLVKPVLPLVREPSAAPAAAAAPPEPRPTTRWGVSAWSGDWEGQTPDGQLRWTFECAGEIAMGGPTFGDVTFSNGIKLRSVGPAFGVSDDGTCAAFPIPSRQRWSLLVLSIPERQLRHLTDEGHFWEVDDIRDSRILGRRSPLVDNGGHELELATVLRLAPPSPLGEWE